MPYSCTTGNVNAVTGCPDNSGATKHLMIAETNPGTVALSDLQGSTFVNGKLLAAEGSRWYLLKNVFKQEQANNEMTMDAGTFRSKPIRETSGTDVYKYETSLCMRYLTNALKREKTYWVAYITENDLIGVQSIPGDLYNVRFFEAKVSGADEKTTPDADGLANINITHESTSAVPEYRDFTIIEDLTPLQGVVLDNTGIVAGTSFTVQAKGCNKLTNVVDLDVTKFVVTVNGSAATGTFTHAGAGVYSYAITSPVALVATDVVTVAYQPPVTSTEPYLSNTMTKVVA